MTNGFFGVLAKKRKLNINFSKILLLFVHEILMTFLRNLKGGLYVNKMCIFFKHREHTLR